MNPADKDDPSSAHEKAVFLVRITTPEAIRYGVKIMIQETMTPAVVPPYPGELMYCHTAETAYILFCRASYQGSGTFIARANGTFINDDGLEFGKWFYKDEYKYEHQPEFT